MANKYSSLTPYNYSFNNPVMFNDPSGADPPQTINYSAQTSQYWGVGWEIGHAITNIPSYQEWKQETWLPWRKEKLGY